MAFEVLESLAHYGGWDDAMAGGYHNIWYPGPEFDRFRRDPRFPRLMEKVGLVEYWREYGWPDYCRSEGKTVVCGGLEPSAETAPRG